MPINILLGKLHVYAQFLFMLMPISRNQNTSIFTTFFYLPIYYLQLLF